MNKNFFKSPQCKSGKYCQVCRTKSKTSFRTTVQKRYDDVKEVDFERPYGKKWEHKEEDKAKATREEVRKRMQILADHKNRQRKQEDEIPEYIRNQYGLPEDMGIYEIDYNKLRNSDISYKKLKPLWSG